MQAASAHGAGPEQPVSFAMPLPRSEKAPSAARRALGRRFGAALAPRAMADAFLVVSELVTNAVRHGEGAVLLTAELVGDRLRVEVLDESLGSAPAIRAQGSGDGGGWGLRIVDALTVAWGARDGSTRVWAEIPAA